MCGGETLDFGQRDDSQSEGVKALASEPDDLSSSPRALKIGEN